MTITITGTNGKGVKTLIRKFEELRSKAVYVGIPAESNPLLDKGFNMASLAAVLEFGNARIPSRPFLRDTLEKYREKYTALFAEQLKQGKSPEQAMSLIAVIAQGDVQDNIVNGNWTPNAKSTIRRKKSSKPLINTGRLRQSIRGVVK